MRLSDRKIQLGCEKTRVINVNLCFLSFLLILYSAK